VNDPFEVVGLFAAIGSTLLMLYVGFIGVRWLHRKIEPGKDELTTGQHDALDRVARLEEVEARMAELEERLDFAERLLSQAQAQAALPPGERV
jgi:hypothetical protein